LTNLGEETKEYSDEDYDPELPADALPPKSSSRKDIVDQAKETESADEEVDEDEEDEDESVCISLRDMRAHGLINLYRILNSS
jgi:hypothetical protein